MAAMQAQFFKTIREHCELQSQLAKAHQDIANVRAELELKDASKTKRDSEKYKLVLQHKQKEMETDRESLEYLREQLREANCVRDALQSELTEVKEQLDRECADKVAVESGSLAKTQQVKQYKKQVDHYKVKLQECGARIEEYQVQLEQCKHELVYCQIDLKRREDFEQNTVSIRNTNHIKSIYLLTPGFHLGGGAVADLGGVQRFPWNPPFWLSPK